ncbi:Bax inhibitor-1/YccA family protein [Streptococcus dentiloxodontae]
MENNIIYTQSVSGINRFYAKIYALVGMGLGLSAVISWLMLGVFWQNFVNIIINYSWVPLVAIGLELVLVVVASAAARRNTPAALPLFLVYSALNGFTLSFIIIRYAQSTVFQALLSAAIIFFVMALIGATTKRDLSGMAKFLLAALFGIIIASVVNFFIVSSGFSYIISIASVLIFSGLIAYDNQLIKNVYNQLDGRPTDGWAVSMALSLYLDFINLFLNLLRIFGRNN